MSEPRRPSILVVEDENVVAMDLAATLEKLGYPIAGIAATGEDAVAIARRAAPGLVLMDIHLRGEIDGIRAATEIQQKLLIPVVYLTAYSDEPTLQRARVTHPFGYLLKPFEEREIEVAIQIALYRHEMEAALRASERRLDAMLRSIGDAVIATDPGRCVTYMNPAAERLVGWRSERAQGRPLSDVLRVTPRADGLFSLTPGSGVVPVELVESPVLDVAGNTTGLVVVVRDVSERLRAQEAHDREIAERAARGVAERDHARASLKGEISLVLADLPRCDDLLEPLHRVTELVAQSVADACVLHVEVQERVLRTAAHADPTRAGWAEELDRRWPADRGGPRGTQAVLRSGRPELHGPVPDETLARVARDPQHLDALRQTGIRSVLTVPVRARGTVLGAVSLLTSTSGREYDESDVVFAQQVADRVALALDNLRLYREAQAAKAAAEGMYLAEQQARSEAEALFRVADSLAAAQLDVEAVVQRVTDEARALVGAQFAAFFYRVDQGTGAFELYTLSGAPREAFENFGVPRNTPIFGPTFRGEAVVRLDDVRKDPRYCQMEPHRGMPKGHLPVTSYLAVPVVSRTGAVIGGLFFGHPEPARFTEQHERITRALAAHAAVAVDNARLFRAMREAEERQAGLVRDLERAVRFSDMFVGILGHDLRNPLSAITTGATLALKRADSDRIRAPVERILSSAGRMTRMIDQILDFTLVRLGRGIPLVRRDLDLAELSAQVLDEIRGGSGRPVDLRLEVNGDTSGVWDPDRLGQLLSNLAGNAVQHGRPAAPVRVRIDGSGTADVTVEVHNEGTVDPDLLPKMFEPLRGGERRQGSSGLGLGMFISQQIVAAHGGRIRVESDEASGTRFVFHLPRHPPADGESVFHDAGPGAERR